MHPVVAARIKKYASGPPKWSILPAYVKTKMTAVEKKKFQDLIKKESAAAKMFHKYEVVVGQENRAWKYYGEMFSTISKIEKFQSQLKKRYS